MAQRVAQHAVRTRLFAPKVVVRVDLHGVTTSGPRRSRSLMRWEWIEDVVVAGDGVRLRSPTAELHLPRGAFRMTPAELAERLRAASALDRRQDVIGELNSR